MSKFGTPDAVTIPTPRDIAGTIERAPLADLSVSRNLFIEIFHATTSGANNEVLHSFKEHGIDPQKFSDGHGQGRGFYVFTTREQAERHASNIKEGDIVKNGTREGTPMVISAVAVLDPRHWELDVEVHRGLATIFLAELIRENGGSLELREADGKSIHLYRPSEASPNFVVKCKTDNQTSRCYGVEPGTDDGTLNAGRVIGRTIAAIRESSAYAERWTEYVAQKIAESAHKGLALKYIGKESLPVRRIDLLATPAAEK